MSPLILLALLAGVPLVLSVVLRIKPLYLFVSIVTGFFLATLLGEDASLVFRSFIHVSQPDIAVGLFLLLLPLLFTYIRMRGTLSTSSLPFQFILLVADALLLTELLLPLLSPGVRVSIQSTRAGSVAYNAHDVLIAGVAMLHVLVMWIMRPKADAHGHHGKKH